MPELGFGKKSDFDLKIASLGPPLVRFLVEIWSDFEIAWSDFLLGSTAAGLGYEPHKVQDSCDRCGKISKRKMNLKVHASQMHSNIRFA